jgi:hypothetical protein
MLEKCLKNASKMVQKSCINVLGLVGVDPVEYPF